MVGPGKIFKRPENAILNLVFANSMPILLTFKETEFAESVLDIPSYAEFTTCPPWLFTATNFQNGGSQMARESYCEIDLCAYGIL